MKPAPVATIVKKDWSENTEPLAMMTGVLVVPAILVTLGIISGPFAQGMFAGAIVFTPFMFVEVCWTREQRFETVDLLLQLPIARRHLALAKLASVFSMTLFAVTAAGFALRSLAFLFYANAVALLLASIYMAAALVVKHPHAPQIAVLIVVALAFPFRPRLESILPIPWLASHAVSLGLAAYAIVALLACFTVRKFEQVE